MSEAVNHEVLDRLAELLPDLRERAQETEDLRRIPEQSIKQLHDTGFFRLLQPKRYGGY
ncbi:MAG: flavin-dependent monooxygenase, partial [Mycobacteriaceae bacterium]